MIVRATNWIYLSAASDMMISLTVPAIAVPQGCLCSTLALSNLLQVALAYPLCCVSSLLTVLSVSQVDKVLSPYSICVNNIPVLIRPGMSQRC